MPALSCFCATLRRVSRALTQLYEHELRPLGIRVTQLTILQVLSRAGGLSQRKLGEILSIDSTTLTRTLKIMIRQGWIAERRGQDRRERLLRLTKSGFTQLKSILPVWREIQARLRRQLGEQVWENLPQLTDQVTKVVAAQGVWS
ncbi:MAG TPA: MarR family transcriptional regulator [Candidatus Bathyarchaeia archaeon]|nr:MarR family transcriptional regulator [Candidatus Bathyarchaeia archaeon]